MTTDSLNTVHECGCGAAGGVKRTDTTMNRSLFDANGGGMASDSSGTVLTFGRAASE